MEVARPMTPSSNTDRQEEVLLVIGRALRDRGASPTVRELAEAVGITSTSVAVYNLRRLTAQGYLTVLLVEARGIRLTDLGHAWLAERGVVTPEWALGRLLGAGRAVVADPTPATLDRLAE